MMQLTVTDLIGVFREEAYAGGCVAPVQSALLRIAERLEALVPVADADVTEEVTEPGESTPEAPVDDVVTPVEPEADEELEETKDFA